MKKSGTIYKSNIKSDSGAFKSTSFSNASNSINLGSRISKPMSSCAKSKVRKDSFYSNETKQAYSRKVSPPPGSDLECDQFEALPFFPVQPLVNFKYVNSTPDIPTPAIPVKFESTTYPVREPLPSPEKLSKSEAKNALLEYVSNRYCWSSRAAKRLNILKIEHSSAFHYTLETFTESRQLCWTYEPYMGEKLEGALCNDPPDPWNVWVESPGLFKNHSVTCTLPNTDCLRNCHSCNGTGEHTCKNCQGTGLEICYSCIGDGYKAHSFMEDETERCFYCEGKGKQKCLKCNGDGTLKCKVCKGRKQIKCYIKLTVNWINHIDDYISEKDEIPKDRLRTVSGNLIFNESNDRLWAVNHFPDESINKASQNFLNKHFEDYISCEKPIAQRQRVYLIPISVVKYTWKGKSKTFWVYGNEKETYAPDYPQRHCFGCIIC